MENFSKLGLALFAFLILAVSVSAETAPCQRVTYEHSEYTVCEVDLRRQSVRLFWKKPDGYPYEYLSSLPRALGDHSLHLLFATNGGMYHPDNSPVGLYVEEGRELVRANTSAGPGNFHMRPNGVFYVTGEVAGVLETRSFIKQRPQVDFATQSGPMLVIDGEVMLASFDMADQENTESVLAAATLAWSCSPYRNQKFRLASSRVSSGISFDARTLCF